MKQREVSTKKEEAKKVTQRASRRWRRAGWDIYWPHVVSKEAVGCATVVTPQEVVPEGAQTSGRVLGGLDSGVQRAILIYVISV